MMEVRLESLERSSDHRNQIGGQNHGLWDFLDGLKSYSVEYYAVYRCSGILVHFTLTLCIDALCMRRLAT